MRANCCRLLATQQNDHQGFGQGGVTEIMIQDMRSEIQWYLELHSHIAMATLASAVYTLIEDSSLRRLQEQIKDQSTRLGQSKFAEEVEMGTFSSGELTSRSNESRENEYGMKELSRLSGAPWRAGQQNGAHGDAQLYRS